MPEDKLKKLKDVLGMVNDGLTKADFTNSFKNLSDLVIRIQKELIKRIDDKIGGVIDGMKSECADMLALCKKNSDSAVASMKEEFSKTIQRLVIRLGELKDGRDGKNGADGYTPIKGKDYFDGKDGSPDTGDQIVDKINHDSEKLINKNAVQGLVELEKKVGEVISIRPIRGFFGAKGIGLYVGNSKKLLTAQQLNFIAGSGISITYAHANGRNDLTFSASGGALAVLAATGTIDDSNKSFTFASEPSVVVVNGASYRNGAGVTIVGTTATLDSAPGTGSDIYGIG